MVNRNEEFRLIALVTLMNDKRRKGAVGIKQIVVIGVLVVAGLALTVMYNRHIQKERLEAERQAEEARLKRERAEEAARAQRQKEEEEAEKKRRAEQEAREKAQGCRGGSCTPEENRDRKQETRGLQHGAGPFQVSALYGRGGSSKRKNP